MQLDGHIFLGPDNGSLSLVKGRADAECILVDSEAIQRKGSKSFQSQNVLAMAAGFLSAGGSFEALGDPHQMKENLWGEPSYSNNALRGIIIHIDHFGNAITNIVKDEFLDLKEGRRFQIFIRNLRLQRIVSTYADVSKGEALGIFGDNQHLEISIREGSAHQLLGLNVQDMLTIEFEG